MERRERILIGCPVIGKYVLGSYPCDAHGRYLLRGESFSPELTRCSQMGGRCTELLCALHRYNRKGRGTWYPTDVLAFTAACQGGRVEAPQNKHASNLY
jgi:hypothetical protein